MNPPSQIPALHSPSRPTGRHTAVNLAGVHGTVGWRGAGSALAPYVLLAVFVPGGLAIAPILYWRNRRR
jgi:hypothetical protein